MSSLVALVISRLSRVLRRSMPLFTALSVVLLGARSAAGQNPITITGYTGPTYVGQAFVCTYYYDEENCGDGYYVNQYRISYTIRNNTTSNQYPWISIQCTALCSNSAGPMYYMLGPSQTTPVYVNFYGPAAGSVSATVTVSTTRSNYTTCWSQWIEEEYDCQFSAAGPWDSISLSVTATSTNATASPGIAAYRPTVTPKTTTETIPFASAMSRSFTIQNAGSQTATYSITAACGSMTGCSPSKTTTTLAPSATDNVDVSFTSPGSINTSNTIKLIATYTNAGGQTVADTGTRPTVTPSQRPGVSPHTGTIAAAPGTTNYVTFTVAVNGSYGSNASIWAVCTGWITGCSVTDVWDNENAETTIVSVSYTASAALGGPTYPTASLKLVAQLGVAADTGVLTVAMGYYKPTLTPKTTTISESANTTRSANFTLTNSGNLATGYSITTVCTGVTNCTRYPTFVYLNPGQASGINVGYTAPAMGQSGTVKVITTHDGYPTASLTEADTAVVNTTGADVAAPTMTFGSGLPTEGQTVSVGALSFTLNACDLDGQLQTPTISANGVSVTPSFTSGSTSSCNTTKAATVSFVAVPGANTINFSVSDGSHTTSVVRHFTYSESWEATPIVTALVPSHLLRGGQQWADTFSVRNAGPLTVSYGLQTPCITCTPSSSSISVGPNQTVKMAVNYTTPTNTTGIVVWPMVTYTPVSGSPTTVGDVYTTVYLDQAAPTAVITGPTPNSTISAFPNLSVAWCDADGQLVQHTLALDGTPLADTFTSQTQSGCTSSGTSSWSNVALTLGAHTVTATATDVSGHVTTSTLSFTLALPAISAFQPDVTPRTATPSLIPTEQTLVWAVRNVGTLSAQYQITADCSSIATVSGCQLDKTTVTLAANAVDSVHMTYQVTTWPSTPPTFKLSARYTDIVGRVIADTAAVSATIPSVAALFQPQLPVGGYTQYLTPNSISALSIAVTNTGIAPVTYHMDASVALPFTIYVAYLNDSLIVQPGQTAFYQVQVRSPIELGVSGQLNVTASYTFSGQTVSATMLANMTTRATAPAILMATRGGSNQSSPGSGSITVDIVNIGVGTLEGQLSNPPHCTAIITNCRFAPRAEGTTISLAASASTPITVFYDMEAPSPGSGDGGLVEIIFNGKAGTQSAGIYRTGGANVTRQVVADWVSVTPDNLPVRYNPGQPDQTYSFEIRNAGTVDARFDYTVSCAGVAGPGSPSAVTCAAQPGQTRLLAHDSVETVLVHFATTSTDSTGYVTLTATKVGNSSIHDAGSIAVRLNVTIADIAVSAATVNPDAVIARNQCITIAAGSNAAYECGDLRIVHALPATTTMNKTRAPALIYNSAHATGHAIIAADLRIKEGISPLNIDATLQIKSDTGGVVRLTQTRRIPWGPELSDGQWHRIALQFDAAANTLVDVGKQAGLFRYTLEAKSVEDGALVSRDSGFVVVVDRSSSVFGKGWWLDGLEQIIVPRDPTKLLWVGGDGSARVYSLLSTNVWTVRPTLDHVDSLTFAGSTYRRHLANGAYVEFSSNGNHLATVNQYGHKTQFVQDALGVRTIKLPVVSGTPPQYQFDYENTSTAPRVSSITPPRSSRVVTLHYASSSSRDLTAIRGPTADSVRFTQNGNGVIDARYDRLAHQTGFAYDSARLVRQVTINNSPQNVVSSFCAAESASLTACATSGILRDSVRTSFDGPRTDVPDVTQFYVTRYGAPRLIVNAIGERTTIDRTDTLWRLLPTALTQPNGHKVITEYDSQRGLPLRTKDIGLLAPSDTAITNYSWHATWDEIIGITSPMGIVDTMSYRTDSAFRVWQQHGSDQNRRVSFYYDNNTRLVSSTAIPLEARDSVQYSSVTGNVIGMKSPAGHWTTIVRDDIGRDTVTLAAIDASDLAHDNADPSKRLKTVTVRDVFDRVTKTEAIGLANGSSQTLEVQNYFDREGRLDSLKRRSIPDPNSIGIMLTKYSYDSLGRMTGERAPDGQLDSTRYDLAGNAVWHRLRTGDTTSMDYDWLNRLKTRRIPAKTEAAEGSFPRYAINGSSGVTTLYDQENFTYDALGSVLTANNNAANVTRTYYPNGSLHTERQQIATYAGGDYSRHDYSLSYLYDLDGRRKQLTRPDLHIVAYDYDYAGKTGDLQLVSSQEGGSSVSQAGVASFKWDLAGRLAATIRGANNFLDTLTYDDAGRLLSRTETGSAYPGGLIHRDSTQYDARGKVLRVRTRADSIYTSYTGLGAVASWQRWSLTGATGSDESFETDALGNTRTNTVNNLNVTWGGQTTYGYKTDGTGRLIQRAGAGGVADPAWSADYDLAGNQKVTLSSEWSNGWLFLSPDRSYYGSDGRLRVFDRQANSVSYQNGAPADRLGTFDEYRYDAFGRRVLVRSRRNDCEGKCQSAIERFIWDGNAILGEIRYPGRDSIAPDSLEVDDGYVMRTDTTTSLDNPLERTRYNPHFGRAWYTHGLEIDRPFMVERQWYGQGASYRALYSWQNADSVPPSEIDPGTYAITLHYDNNGRVDEGTIGGQRATASGMSVEWPGHDVRVFGGRIVNHEVPPNWVGGLVDEMRGASGLMYRRNRYYDPATGRFTQEDPIGLAGGLNLYGFAHGDPVNFDDPFGLSENPRQPLADGWTARVDAYNIDGAASHEIHVFDPKGDEAGIFGPNGWVGKHGKGTPNITEDAFNRLNGLNVDQLRRQGNLGEKGTQDIRGFKYLGKVGRSVEALGVMMMFFDSFQAQQAARTNGTSWAHEMLKRMGAPPLFTVVPPPPRA